ncbi:MAG: hypothetical protein KC466_08815 [Myxococcales bacterium]|nr:hypothetical protein [Myxococcales bacterium]
MAYLFDPKILHDVTKRAVGQPKEAMFRQVIEELAERYPGHIETKQRWIFNNAGGAMGAMTLLHCSLKEYIILFGSPIGTEGHSGRYATEVHDFMLEGEMWCYHEGEFERTVYKPGDAAYLGRDRVKGYKLHEGGWMVEYARGPIPLMLPFGLADTVFSTLDFKTFGRTLAGYTRLVLRELRGGGR